MAARFLVFILAAVFLLASVEALASSLIREMPAQARAWREKVSPKEFDALIRMKVAEIPEMKELWDDLATNPEKQKEIFLGGGVLRGLIQWLEESLQKKSYAEVKAIRPPSLDDLRQQGADQDLFLPRKLTDADLPAPFNREGGWDVLEAPFLTASLAAGGSGIEKIGVNPFVVYDPTHAVADYHAGRIEYLDVSEQIFARFRGIDGALIANSKFALVLRHLRFLILFNSVEVTKGDVAELKAALSDEKLYRAAYFVDKAFKKLDKEVRTSRLDLDAVLEELGIREELTKHSYFSAAYLEEHLYKPDYINFVLLNQVKRSAVHPSDIMRAILKTIPKAKTVDDYIRILTPGVERPSKLYIAGLATFWIDYAKKIKALKPTATELETMATLFADQELLIRKGLISKYGLAENLEGPRHFEKYGKSPKEAAENLFRSYQSLEEFAGKLKFDRNKAVLSKPDLETFALVLGQDKIIDVARFHWKFWYVNSNEYTPLEIMKTLNEMKVPFTARALRNLFKSTYHHSLNGKAAEWLPTVLRLGFANPTVAKDPELKWFMPSMIERIVTDHYYPSLKYLQPILEEAVKGPLARHSEAKQWAIELGLPTNALPARTCRGLF